MSLATRCTACGTIFRVVQDQLRVSEGWVRCGRCAEVFDAREQLFDIDREAPPPWPVATPGAVAVQVPPPPPPPEPRPVWTSAPTPVSASVNTYARPPEPAPILPPNLQARTMREAEEHTWTAPDTTVTPPSAMYEEPPIEEPVEAPMDSRPEPQWVEDDAPPPAPAAPLPSPPPPAIEDFGTDAILAPGLAEAAEASEAETTEAPAQKKDNKADAAAPPPMPEFMRRAQRNEQWRRPRVRIALGLAAALLVAGLAVQFALQFHDAIVAVQPATRPAMQALCEFGGCELKPWRRIDVVGVDASALNTAGPNNQYQLSLSLRNKSGLEVAAPWVELSLTDASGSTVARRTLAPSDFKGGKTSMAPGAEMPLQVLLSTGEQRVSGYSVEIFHP